MPRSGDPVAHDGASTCQVELFGLARLLTGRKVVTVVLPRDAGTRELIGALAEACPALVDRVVCGDRKGLQEGYVFNLNGNRFLSEEEAHLQHGDTVLLLSSVAGG